MVTELVKLTNTVDFMEVKFTTRSEISEYANMLSTHEVWRDCPAFAIGNLQSTGIYWYSLRLLRSLQEFKWILFFHQSIFLKIV